MNTKINSSNHSQKIDRYAISKKEENLIKLSDYKRISVLLRRWWRLLKDTACVYVYIFATFELFTFLSEDWLLSNLVKKDSLAYWLLGFAVIIFFVLFQGSIYLADGLISSLLKTPFGQINYAINKSGLDDEVADNLVAQITEVNEHFKETFKKFGIISVSQSLKKICSNNFGSGRLKGGEIVAKKVGFFPSILTSILNSQFLISLALSVPLVYSSLFKINYIQKAVYDLKIKEDDE